MNLLSNLINELGSVFRNKLNWLAVAFLGLYATILTLSPTVKFRSWSTDLLWSHWAGFFLWFLGFFWFCSITKKYLNLKDTTLISVIGLLVGWGILTIWRISIIFGIRQAIWFLASVGIAKFLLSKPQTLAYFKKYKYLLLMFGLILSGLTFLFGTYPGGIGPRLWLGARGLYFQPSELLKLVLIIYLSAFFSEKIYFRIKIIQTIFPTIILVLAALFLLIAQRDLGTALIFIAIYIFMLFITFGKKWILATGAGIIALAALVGYFSIDLIRIRFQGWMLPWSDTQAGSYQITQSIIAIAAGGLFGTGIGLGNPKLIPISHSDFMFSAIVEETGLFGAIALLILYAIILFRGFSIALKSSNLYYRYLAAGISLFLTSQAILIIGGNIRLLPITGVTLPFLSYGGSSLLITFLSACILLIIDNDQNSESEIKKGFYGFQILGVLFSVSFLLIAAVTGWWAIIRSNDLQLRTDNPRHLISARYVKRGSILDRNDTIIVNSIGDVGQITRQNNYPPLTNTLGFMDNSYGSSGLEASLEDYLGGEKGYPAFDLWFNYLLYDQPLPGRDVRLTINLNLQTSIDGLLEPYIGSAIVMNAETGEILAIASHPYINSNELKENWDKWKADINSPFVNRAVQGAYPINSLITPFLLTKARLEGLPEYDPTLNVSSGLMRSDCAITRTTATTLNQAINDGCNSALIQTIGEIGSDKVTEIISTFQFGQTPDVGIPITPSEEINPLENWQSLFFDEDPLRSNPLRIAVSASSITHQGLLPHPKLLSAVDTSKAGWVFLSGEPPEQVITRIKADEINEFLKSSEIQGWEVTTQGIDAHNRAAWYAAGTPVNWHGTPITVVLVLENQHPAKARSIGREIFSLAVE